MEKAVNVDIEAGRNRGLHEVPASPLDSLNAGVHMALAAVDTGFRGSGTIIWNELTRDLYAHFDTVARGRIVVAERKARTAFRTIYEVTATREQVIEVIGEYYLQLMRLQDAARFLQSLDLNQNVEYDFFKDIHNFEEGVVKVEHFFPRDLATPNLRRYLETLRDAINAIKARVHYDIKSPDRMCDAQRLEVFVALIEGERENLRIQLAKGKITDVSVQQFICDHLATIRLYITNCSDVLGRHFGYEMMRSCEKAINAIRDSLENVRREPRDDMARANLRSAVRQFTDIGFALRLNELYSAGYFLERTSETRPEAKAS